MCTPNADYVVRAHRDYGFQQAIEGAYLRVPDGMWIVYASRIAGRPLRSTVTGRLLLPAVAQAAAKGGLRIALVGAGPGVAPAAAMRLRQTYSGLQITMAVTPPTPFIVGSSEDARLCGELSQGNPDIVFVALGAPKQEMWMQRHTNEFGGAVLVGVGAAFDIVSGRFREAPSWMTRWGFEWLYRMVQEPRRLARRYLVDDPWILWWALRSRRRRRRSAPKS